MEQSGISQSALILGNLSFRGWWGEGGEGGWHWLSQRWDSIPCPTCLSVNCHVTEPWHTEEVREDYALPVLVSCHWALTHHRGERVDHALPVSMLPQWVITHHRSERVDYALPVLLLVSCHWALTHHRGERVDHALPDVTGCWHTAEGRVDHALPVLTLCHWALTHHRGARRWETAAAASPPQRPAHPPTERRTATAPSASVAASTAPGTPRSWPGGCSRTGLDSAAWCIPGTAAHQTIHF